MLIENLNAYMHLSLSLSLSLCPPVKKPTTKRREDARSKSRDTSACLLADVRAFSPVGSISFCISCIKMTTFRIGFAATSSALRSRAAAAGRAAQSARSTETRADPVMGDEEMALGVG